MTASAPGETEKRRFGRYVDCLWEPNQAGQGRRARRGGRYRAFIPDPIADREFPLDPGADAALHQATKALERLQHVPSRVATLDAVAQNLLRSESVASSRIEDVQISHRRLARAARLTPGAQRLDNRAQDVLGNVDAMREAIEVGGRAEKIAVADLIEMHRLLLRHADDRRIAGIVRTTQNWIGGNVFNPLEAAFVPPPAEHVPGLLDDLCRFASRHDLPPIIQSAIAQLQFETIHPFADGNGRAGRELIYSVLRRRGEVTRYIPPISLILAAAPKSYIGGLDAYRAGEASKWCESFAEETARAAREAERLAEEIESLEEEWLRRIGEARQGSAVRLLIADLPEQPVLNVGRAGELI